MICFLQKEASEVVKICYTGGGTAGHIIPALVVADALRAELASEKLPLDAFWIGSKDESEQALIRAAGIRCYGIPSGKLRRYFSMKNFTDVFRIMGGVFRSLTILRKERPDVLFSKGGFVSVPPVMAAWLLRIPAITHESDASVGLATRINARFVSKVCVSSADAAKGLQNRYQEKVVVTGNPVRKEILAGDPEKGRALIGIGKNEPLILVLGGSLGALQINELVWGGLDALCAQAFVVHQTGKKTWRAVEHDRYRGVPYLHDELPDLLAAATVVVSRAGAGALAELVALGKPMLLLPLGTNASRGDQILNAERLSQAGAAEVLYQEDASQRAFLDRLLRLLQERKRRESLSAACGRIADTCGAIRIVAELLSACKFRENEVRGT